MTNSEYYRGVNMDGLVRGHAMMADALNSISQLPDQAGTCCAHFEEAVKLANEALTAMLEHFKIKGQK